MPEQAANGRGIAGLAALAIFSALLISLSGCIQIADDSQLPGNPSSVQQAPYYPSSVPNFSSGRLPYPNTSGALGGSNLSSLLALARYMMAVSNGSGFPMQNSSGTDASQLALIQQIMSGANGTGGMSAQQLAFIQQMLANRSTGGYAPSGLQPQQLAALQQMMGSSGGSGAGAGQLSALQQMIQSGGSGTGGLSAQQLAALQQMMGSSGSGTGGMSAEQLAALQQMMGSSGSSTGTPVAQPSPSIADSAPVTAPAANGAVSVTYFYKPGCPYCAKVAPLITQMKQDFGNYNWSDVNVETSGGYAQFVSTIHRLNLPASYFVVPFVAVNDRALVGVSEINSSLPSVLAGLS